MLGGDTLIVSCIFYTESTVEMPCLSFTACGNNLNILVILFWLVLLTMWVHHPGELLISVHCYLCPFCSVGFGYPRKYCYLYSPCYVNCSLADILANPFHYQLNHSLLT